MKFGKSLTIQIEETIPGWRDKFISYKDLKKKLKLLEPSDGDRPGKRQKVDTIDANGSNECTVVRGEIEEGLSAVEIDFIRLLEDELEKFNAFFMEKEEEYIIKLKVLQERVAEAMDSKEEMIQIRKEMVDFHGEMVLLENYSALNYTGLVKILKKYDKRTGALIRLPFIQRVLQEPFVAIDVLYKLVKACETMLDCLFPVVNLQTANEDADREDGEDPSPSTATTSASKSDGFLRLPKELAEIEYMKSVYTKRTISALKSLTEIRSKSSTVSAFSLPPLQINGLDLEKCPSPDTRSDDELPQKEPE